MKATQIFLVGYRGTGKSTVGMALGQKLNWEFQDADVVLERRAGKTIRQIFAEEGEPGFRDRESEVLAELTANEPLILATGGGVILREGNREKLRRGFVVWLQARPEVILDRIEKDHSTAERRPNLASGGLTEIEQMMSIRYPLYESVADYSISTDTGSPESLADLILAARRQILCLPAPI